MLLNSLARATLSTRTGQYTFAKFVTEQKVAFDQVQSVPNLLSAGDSIAGVGVGQELISAVPSHNPTFVGRNSRKPKYRTVKLNHPRSRRSPLVGLERRPYSYPLVSLQKVPVLRCARPRPFRTRVVLHELPSTETPRPPLTARVSPPSTYLSATLR